MREALHVSGMHSEPSLRTTALTFFSPFSLGGQDQAERTQVEGMLARFGQSTEYIPHLKASNPACCAQAAGAFINLYLLHSLLCADDIGQHQLALCSVYGSHWVAQAGNRAFSLVSSMGSQYYCRLLAGMLYVAHPVACFTCPCSVQTRTEMKQYFLSFLDR
jgi:hypothetical protein